MVTLMVWANETSLLIAVHVGFGSPEIANFRIPLSNYTEDHWHQFLEQM